MSEADRKEMIIEEKIFDLLVRLGISPRYKGFRLLSWYIKDQLAQTTNESNMEVYQRLADLTDDAWENTARAMRFAMQRAQEIGGEENIRMLIGQVPPSRGKSDPVAFARLCISAVRRDLCDL